MLSRVDHHKMVFRVDDDAICFADLKDVNADGGGWLLLLASGTKRAEQQTKHQKKRVDSVASFSHSVTLLFVKIVA